MSKVLVMLFILILKHVLNAKISKIKGILGKTF